MLCSQLYAATISQREKNYEHAVQWGGKLMKFENTRFYLYNKKKQSIFRVSNFECRHIQLSYKDLYTLFTALVIKFQKNSFLFIYT